MKKTNKATTARRTLAVAMVGLVALATSGCVVTSTYVRGPHGGYRQTTVGVTPNDVAEGVGIIKNAFDRPRDPKYIVITEEGMTYGHDTDGEDYVFGYHGGGLETALMALGRGTPVYDHYNKKKPE